MFKTALNRTTKQKLNQLLETDNTLSELAALKQDAKDFNSAIMRNERKKHSILKPLYDISQTVLPKLEISRQNIDYYANLAHYYTVSDLERFNEEQRCLYLLCYAFKRYQQITDTLVDAFDYHTKKIEATIKEKAKEKLLVESVKINKQIGKLLLIYVDEKFSDDLQFGKLRQLAFKILPKDSIQSTSEKLINKPKRKQELQWKERDKAKARYKHHLRSILETIQFDSLLPKNPLLTAINWMKGVLQKDSHFQNKLLMIFRRP